MLQRKKLRCLHFCHVVLASRIERLYLQILHTEWKNIGYWTCFAAGCKKNLPKETFVLAKMRFTEQQLTQVKYRVCDSCMTARKKAEDEITASTVRNVVRRLK